MRPMWDRFGRPLTQCSSGSMLGILPAPSPSHISWGLWGGKELAHLGLEWGGEGCGGQENKNNSLFREAPRADLFIPKMAIALCTCRFLIKILMARDIDFEPKMGFRLWFGYINSGNSNILNNFISFLCALFILNSPSCDRALSHSVSIRLCFPSSSSHPDMKLFSLSSQSYRLVFYKLPALFKITA